MKLHENGQIKIGQYGIHTLLDTGAMERTGGMRGQTDRQKAREEPASGLTRKTNLRESTQCETPEITLL